MQNIIREIKKTKLTAKKEKLFSLSPKELAILHEKKLIRGEKKASMLTKRTILNILA